MKKYLFSMSLLVAVLSGFSLLWAAASTTVVADIPYAFMVSGQTLPAGQYEFQNDSTKVDVMKIYGLNTRKEIIIPYTTRLAARGGDQCLLVFDRVGEQYYLSEIHVPTVDGFYFKGAPGKHTHATIKANKKS